MERYEKYKPSGIEWIGEIPEHWEMKRISYLISLLTDFTANGSFASLASNVKYYHEPNYSRLIRLTDLRDNLLNDGVWVNKLAHNFLSKSELYGGEILMANVGAYAGLVCTMPKIDYKATLGPNMLLLKFKAEIQIKYIYYQLNSTHYAALIANKALSSAQPKLNKDNIKEIISIVPPLQEQIGIAAYLDHKTAEIDQIITNKQKLIVLYEEEKQAIINHSVTRGVETHCVRLNPNSSVRLKPSGVEWLGDIPEHWEVKKLKWKGKIKYGLGQPPKEKIDGLPIIRATNVFRGKIDKNNLVFVDPEDVPYDRDPVLKENDIIVVRSGAYTADSAIITKEFNGAITGYDMVFRCDNSIDPVFVSKCLLSDYILRVQLLVNTLRAAQPHLNREDLGETFIFLPPFSEQQNIVQRIEKESIRLDTIIDKCKKQIELLKEYRTTLISEVVTGKIKISN